MTKTIIPEELKSRSVLKALVQTRNDYQNNRIRTANRLSLKKDGTKQNKKDAQIDLRQIPQIKEILDNSKKLETDMDKILANYLKGIPVYEKFLKGVTGIGPQLSAVLLTQFDIQKAVSVSKMWQYAGLNPGMVKGKKSRVVGKDENGYDILEVYEVDDMVRGDRPTKGYCLPYNAFLKKYLCGVMADKFLMNKSSYAVYYYNYKKRLEESKNPIQGKDDNKTWSETSDGHRDRAAKRYMIKMFLRDLYVNWRTIEGLEVRPPYEEEYLGRRHHFDEEAI